MWERGIRPVRSNSLKSRASNNMITIPSSALAIKLRHILISIPICAQKPNREATSYVSKKNELPKNNCFPTMAVLRHIESGIKLTVRVLFRIVCRDACDLPAIGCNPPIAVNNTLHWSPSLHGTLAISRPICSAVAIDFHLGVTGIYFYL